MARLRLQEPGARARTSGAAPSRERPIQLDRLDAELLDHFRSRFPRPETLDFCEYDVEAQEVVALCRLPRPFADPELIRRFVSHLRWGMFGDWRDFPAFAADVCIWARRHRPLFENDWAFLLLHAMDGGAFSADDRQLLLGWCEDLLMPWQRPLEDRRSHWILDRHGLIELGLLRLLGGKLREVLAANRAHGAVEPLDCLEQARSAGLCDAQHRLRAVAIRECFEALACSHDNQQLPFAPLLPAALQDELVATRQDHLHALIRAAYGP